MIRPVGQHAKCNECLKHRVLLRRLTYNIPAKKEQVLHYREHLARQYRDRVQYWESRTLSRLKVPSDNDLITICCILDSVDHAKLPLPKSAAMAAKEFDGLCRPTLTCTACITHGYCLVLALGQPCLQQNSSSTADLLSYSLNLLASDLNVELRRADIRVQADNASKEAKNNTMCRLLSGLTASRQLFRAELRCLQSGHSHEDVDQFFSQLCSHLTSESELHTALDYQVSLKRWLEQPEVRPHEPRKYVVFHDQVRSWKLVWFDSAYFLFFLVHSTFQFSVASMI